VTAAATAPPASSTPAAANCADPAKVVPENTIAAAGPIPADWASTPNEMPNATTAGTNGTTARTPAAGPDAGGRTLSPVPRRGWP
jgi:hypothetical protein